MIYLSISPYYLSNHPIPIHLTPLRPTKPHQRLSKPTPKSPENSHRRLPAAQPLRRIPPRMQIDEQRIRLWIRGERDMAFGAEARGDFGESHQEFAVLRMVSAGGMGGVGTGRTFRLMFCCFLHPIHHLAPSRRKESTPVQTQT